MYYLAIDLGAGSGRGIVFYQNGGKLVSDEVYRFKDYAIKNDDGMFWDINFIFKSVKIALSKAIERGYDIKAIGIDSWGVDYAVVRADGGLDMPYHYRHKRTRGVIADMNDNVISSYNSYSMSGIAPNEFNTLYQLYRGAASGQLDGAQKILFIPNAIGYMLTGQMATEPTIASTSGFYNRKNGYITELLGKINVDKNLLPQVLPTGSQLGKVKSEIMQELGIKHEIGVYLTCGHDTAAAIACVEGNGESSLFLSSGTWSLFGTVNDKYLLSREAFDAGYTNELAVGGVRLLKNIIGMWIIQESMRRWTREDKSFSYSDIDNKLSAMTAAKSLINVADSDFLAPDDMVDTIKEYYLKTGQEVLDCRYEIALSVYTSLALEYKYSLEELEHVSGNKYNSINIFGGGSKNAILCQLTADSLNVTVKAGITEASGCGNAIVQMIACGELADLSAAAELLEKTYSVIEYKPRANATLDALYVRYKQLKNKA